MAIRVGSFSIHQERDGSWVLSAYLTAAEPEEFNTLAAALTSNPDVDDSLGAVPAATTQAQAIKAAKLKLTQAGLSAEELAVLGLR